LRASVIVALSVIAVLISGTFSLQSVFAQDLGGGVQVDGEWYVGEGLKQGDYFSYKLCHVDYQECADFEMDFWIDDDITTGTETKWLVQAVVYDGNKIVKGTMELGKVAPEPTGGSKEISPYRSAFKTSIVWLSAFATADKPKEFSMPSWGKIGNIGGQQVRPTDTATITTPAGTFETVEVTWYTGGYLSQVWVLDGFPFPVKANTFTQVPEGIAPNEYQFQLLDYQENISQNPFSDIVSTVDDPIAAGCPENYSLKDIKKTTKNFKYLMEVKYGPEDPSPGCQIEWFINFKRPADQTEFMSQVQYDIFVVDEDLNPLRSIANDQGRDYLYSPSGQIHYSTTVKETPGTAHYVIWIYGLSPEGYVPTDAPDYLQIDIPISGQAPTTIPKPTPPEPEQGIPSWIKNNAGWWATGQIDNNSFVQGIQFLINEGIMKIPPTSQGTGGSDEIPDWIKNNAGWWAEGLITDDDFVQGIQFLIENGIMKIS
jgi:hypothetical protein